MRYARTLWKEIKLAGGTADMDMEEFIPKTTAGEASVCISVLLTFTQKKAEWLSYRPEFHLAALFS